MGLCLLRPADPQCDVWGVPPSGGFELEVDIQEPYLKPRGFVADVQMRCVEICHAETLFYNLPDTSIYLVRSSSSSWDLLTP